MARKPFDITQTDEYKEYKALQRKADLRLTNLEKLSRQTDYKAVKQYAYRVAEHDIKILGGKARFKNVPITNKKDLRRAMQSVEDFLSSPTSTKTGIDRVYKKRAREINKYAGLTGDDRLTWQDLINVFDFKENSKEKFECGTLFKAFSATKKMDNSKSKGAIKKAGKVIDRLADNEIEEAIMKEIIKEIPKALLL